MRETSIKVLVTTSHRGVFFGELESPYEGGSTLTLKGARNCVYWSTETRGFLGLAEAGPKSGSRVGPPVPRLTLRGVTCVAECTDAAVERWEAEPWS